MIDQDEGERLRRQLRAMSAVNEQLRAQLDAAQAEARSAPRQDRAADPLGDPTRPVPVGLAPRRASVAAEWLDQLPAPPAGARAELVERSDGALFVLEGDLRRRVRSGLLAAAIESLLGERRAVADDELADHAEAAPVEVLEGGSGLAFVVLDGRRLGVRGLPLPFPVEQAAADTIAIGPELDLAAASSPRRAHEANGWIVASAALAATEPPRLAVGPDGAVWVLEGTARRAVPSALLVPALEARLGPATPMAADQLEVLDDGPAVEILEARVGPPFVVLGGKRSAVAGYPLPFPVHQNRADALPDGPPIDLAGALRATERTLTDQRNRAESERAREERKLARVQAALDDARRREARRKANPDPKGELQALIDQRGGLVPAATAAAKKRVKRVVRRARR